MTPAGCAGRICAATTTSSNDCWSTRVASTWACSCGRWSVWARREGSRGGLRPSWPSSWRSGRSHTPCGVTERRRPPIHRHRWCPVTGSSRGRSPHWKHPFSHGLLATPKLFGENTFGLLDPTRTITLVKQLGRRRWKQASGYHRQGRVENAFFRYKSIIGDGLRARSPAGQGSEAVLGCEILNRMTALGRPVSYRIGR